MTTSLPLGVTIHFLRDGLTISVGTSLHLADAMVMRRGQSLLVTPELRAANTDRLGRCALDLTEDEQLQRFGVVHFRPVEFPADQDPLTPDSLEYDDRRAAALQDAGRISDPDEQRVALARIREAYGVPGSARSRTLKQYQR